MSVQSVHVAKERLRILLLADRMHCTPETAEKFTEDIFHTVSKYLSVDPEDFYIKIANEEIHIKITGEKF